MLEKVSQIRHNNFKSFLQKLTLVFIILFAVSSTPLLQFTTSSTSNNVIWSGKCYVDVTVTPVYLYNGSYTNTLFVSSNLSLSLRTSGINLEIRLVPTTSGNILVRDVDATVEKINGYIKEVRGVAVVEIPRNSIGVSFQPITVGRKAVVSVERINSTTFSIILVMNGLNYTEAASVAGYPSAQLSSILRSVLGSSLGDALAVRFVYNFGKEKAYLVDGNSLVEVGERFPLFIYPEAFDPSTVVNEVYNNTVKWIKSASMDPSVLKILAEKVSRAETPEERVEIIAGFVDQVYAREILPGFYYLGKRYVLEGIDNGFTVWGLEDPNSTLRIVQPSGLLVFNSKKFIKMVLINGTGLENALEESLRITKNESVVYEAKGGVLRVSGFNVSSIGSLRIPLPKNNPLRADMVVLDVSPKPVFECSVREALRTVYGGFVNIDDYDIVDLGKGCYGLKDRATGTLEYRVCLGDFNGTDYFVLMGDEPIAKLQVKAYVAWKTLGGIVSGYMLDVYNALSTIVSNAVKNNGVLDEKEALRLLEDVKRKYRILFTREWRERVEEALAKTSTTSENMSSYSPIGPRDKSATLWSWLIVAVAASAITTATLYAIRRSKSGK